MGNGTENIQRDFYIAKKIIESSSMGIVLIEPITKEILFYNEAFIKMYSSDPVGKFCWEFMQIEKEEPCLFCPYNKLKKNPNHPIIWQDFNEKTGRYYKKIDSLIEWEDGRLVHIQYSQDITRNRSIEKNPQEEAKKKKLLAMISLDLSGEEKLSHVMNAVLRHIGLFFEVDAVRILKILNKDMLSLEYMYEWSPKHDKNSHIYDQCNKSHFQNDFHEFIFNTQEEILNTISRPFHEEEHVFYSLLPKSIICLPIRSNDELWGIFTVEALEIERFWTTDEIHTARLICNIITDRIIRDNIQNELFLAKEISTMILASMPFPVFWKNADLKIIGCNTLFSEFVDMDIDYIIGKTDFDIMPEKYALQSMKTDVIVIESKKTRVSEEMCIPDSQGKCRYVDMIKLPFSESNNHNDAIAVLCILKDVVDENSVQGKMLDRDISLQHAVEVAEKSLQAKREFVSSISHKIRTPMDAIIGMLQIAQRTKDLQKIKLCLRKVDSASNQLLGVINNILDVSKIEENELKLKNIDFNLEKMLINITDVIMIKADEKIQELQIHIAQDVPTNLYGDELRINQVLIHLLSNAVKFTPVNGMIQLNISLVESFGDKARLKFEIIDNGIGISQKDINIIFNRYEQLKDNIVSKYGGTGLGISISKRLVELMGGSLGIESEEGRGSNFYFFITVEVKFNYKRYIYDFHQKELQILIIDNKIRSRKQLDLIIRNQGANVTSVTNGRDAMEEIAFAIENKHPYQIVFIYWQLTEPNSIDIIRKIKEDYDNQIEVVMIIPMLDWVRIESIVEELELHYFISKPYFSLTVGSLIQDIMNGTSNKYSCTKKYNYHGKSILIVEDVDTNREVMKAILEPTGIQIDFAINGITAVEQFNKNPNKYDLIFMDIHMPGLNGLDATRSIRAAEHYNAKMIPIIAMTADVFAEDIEDCIEAGMNDHLGKPIEEKKLFSLLDNVFANKKKNVSIEPSVQTDNNYAVYLPFIDVSNALLRLRNSKKVYRKMLISFKNNKFYNELKILADSSDADISQLNFLVDALKASAIDLSLNKLYHILTIMSNNLKKNILIEFFEFDMIYKTTLKYIDKILKEFNISE